MTTTNTDAGAALPRGGSSSPGGSQRPAGGVRSSRGGLADAVEPYGLLALFVAVIVIFSVLRPDTFLSAANFRSIAISGSVLAVAAMALVLPLITGRFDISVGSNVGICSIAVAAAMSDYHLNLVWAMLIGLALGSAVGLINGILVTYLGINSIIATLGMATVLGGLVEAYTGGIPISSGLSPALTNLSDQVILGVPVLFVIMLVIAAIVFVVLEHSIIGRYLAAIGSNEKAAGLTGLPIRPTVLGSFIGAGFLAGAAGILQIASQGNGNPQVGSIEYILPALAAVFLGATTVRPGTYNVLGTLVGLFFVSTTISGLSLVGVQPWITDVFNGLAVMVAVGLSAIFRRRRTGVAVIGA
jgi:ribose transport system permease protein